MSQVASTSLFAVHHEEPLEPFLNGVLVFKIRKRKILPHLRRRVHRVAFRQANELIKSIRDEGGRGDGPAQLKAALGLGKEGRRGHPFYKPFMLCVEQAIDDALVVVGVADMSHRGRETSDISILGEAISSPNSSPVEMAELAELSDRIKGLVKSLSPDEQTIISAMHAGRSRAEVFREMGINRKTGYHKLGRVFAFLADALEEFRETKG